MKCLLPLAAIIVFPASQSLLAQATGKMETIYSFLGPPGPVYPMAGPIIGPGDIIYSTTFFGGDGTGLCGYFACGTVYELTRPDTSGGAWTENTLYSFDQGGVDTSQPQTAPVLASDGTLYGVADYGAYALQPPKSPGQAWTFTVLYNFLATGAPTGGLSIGPNGALYGATPSGGTYNMGTVFELAPPASAGGAWTYTTIYNFRGDGDGVNPGAGVVIGGNGVIYGSTSSGGALGQGAIYGLTFTGGAWEEKVLVSMDSTTYRPAGLALGRNGVLYGVTLDCIIRAIPPGPGETEWTLENIGSSQDSGAESLAVSSNGSVYFTMPLRGSSTACGVADGCGALMQLLPPASAGGAWTAVTLHNFTGQQGDGYQPNSGLVVTKDGSVYGTSYYGGTHFFGMVFRYTPAVE